MLHSREEKACYARLAWQASQALQGREAKLDLRDCGTHGSAIAQAVAAALERELAAGLPAQVVPGAETFARRLRGDETNSGER